MLYNIFQVGLLAKFVEQRTGKFCFILVSPKGGPKGNKSAQTTEKQPKDNLM